MSLSLSQATVPFWTRTLKAMSVMIDKAEAYAEAKKIDPSVLINARLAPDMNPLSFQVQVACDQVKLGVARLAGLKPPSHPDTEKTFDELRARINAVLAYVESVDAAAIDAGEERTIELKFPQGGFSFKGAAYAHGWVNPNLYFHATTFYAILRHNGLPLQKADFLHGLQQ
jgi:uncharacterized protein